MADVALIISDVFPVADSESIVEEYDQFFHEIDEAPGEPFVFIGDGEEVAHDAGRQQLFLADRFRQELVVGDDEELSGALSGIVLPEDTDRKHADEYDLPLRLADAYYVADAVLGNDEKEGRDREPEILEGDDDCSCRYRQKVDSLVDRMDKYVSEANEHGDDAHHVDHLAFPVVFEVVFRMSGIGRDVVLGEYGTLESPLDAPRDHLDAESCRDDGHEGSLDSQKGEKGWEEFHGV